ncbi:hypothetical protein EMIHUDRAFT_443630 [Emiliania huxleyi CCMP1516]|uniref:SP-RING-type domain-containing protein n=2 Tax=Emiliania huxleyi TaxID=2903 RepID=A0A0D3JPM7_EMIH1|nr:hypothetical protein EMIHUDRAFT_443630 [Emiliania huxleyi CCMP1516]EOD25462.1 hypothetical protein EMIHUDRAFT_443630 [Emiliania huxleyi CCMP1516]|eukprot:XP_005777891.1 hypothetical protein EMIHUDRAFT_443630 [Emiliania huxleyi CCMP1516]
MGAGGSSSAPSGFGVLDDDDDECVASSVQLSLNCPLTRLRIGTPVRAAGCSHVECFDLDAWLQCQRAAKLPNWLCPICSSPASPPELRVCSWMQSVLAGTAETTREVIIQPDGSHAAPEPSSAGGSERRKRQRAASVSLDEPASQAPQASQASRAGDDEENPIELGDSDDD